ncbi:MAG: ABC transporter substrate-binding protein [Alphaproteobacteria bacterium]|nr:ABC transporter substrate-binding protein [Alphaproteobacteria bacterium]
MKKLMSLVFSACLLAGLAFAADAPKEPIKIGEMMPYTGGTQFTIPFREGVKFAIDEINAAGGIKGRPLEIIERDDHASPDTAVRLAEDLVFHEKVAMLMGAAFDNVGLAVASYANKNKVPFLKLWSSSCDEVESENNDYYFSSTPCYKPYVGVLAREAAKLPYKRWATIAPNYVYGRVFAKYFISELKRLRPDVTFVAEEYPAPGKINAAAEVRALDKAKPEAIFTCILGPDLVSYLVYTEKVGFLKDKFSISGTNIGSGIAIREFGAAYPKGWLTEGVPEDVRGHPVETFVVAFEKAYGKRPDLMAVYGYQMVQLVAQALRDAKSLSHDDIRNALENVSINGPLGHVAMKNKQLFIGRWLGYTDNQNGKGKFVNAKWYTAEDLFPEAFGKPDK